MASQLQRLCREILYPGFKRGYPVARRDTSRSSMLISPFITREILVDERFRIGTPAASRSWVNSSFFCSETLVISAFLKARPTFASIAFVTVEAVVVGAGAFVAGLLAAEVFVAAGFLAVSGIRLSFRLFVREARTGVQTVWSARSSPLTLLQPLILPLSAPIVLAASCFAKVANIKDTTSRNGPDESSQC
jgi:hypothetical protein